MSVPQGLKMSEEMTRKATEAFTRCVNALLEYARNTFDDEMGYSVAKEVVYTCFVAQTLKLGIQSMRSMIGLSVGVELLSGMMRTGYYNYRFAKGLITKEEYRIGMAETGGGIIGVLLLCLVGAVIGYVCFPLPGVGIAVGLTLGALAGDFHGRAAALWINRSLDKD